MTFKIERLSLEDGMAVLENEAGQLWHVMPPYNDGDIQFLRQLPTQFTNEPWNGDDELESQSFGSISEAIEAIQRRRGEKFPVTEEQAREAALSILKRAGIEFLAVQREWYGGTKDEVWDKILKAHPGETRSRLEEEGWTAVRIREVGP
jgi:hypothetical protein